MTREDVRAGRHGIRRPWLPPSLRALGMDEEQVQHLCYVVIDEIVDGVVCLAISGWPASDAFGRLRFDRAMEQVEVSVPAKQLFEELYGDLRDTDGAERTPSIGDVFASTRIPPPEAAEDGAIWLGPLIEVLGRDVYDLREEARTIAKLAYYSTNARVLSAADAKTWGITELEEESTPTEAARRITIGPERADA